MRPKTTTITIAIMSDILGVVVAQWRSVTSVDEMASPVLVVIPPSPSPTLISALPESDDDYLYL